MKIDKAVETEKQRSFWKEAKNEKIIQGLMCTQRFKRGFKSNWKDISNLVIDVDLNFDDTSNIHMNLDVYLN